MPQTTTCHFRRDTNDKARTELCGLFILQINYLLVLYPDQDGRGMPRPYTHTNAFHLDKFPV